MQFNMFLFSEDKYFIICYWNWNYIYRTEKKAKFDFQLVFGCIIVNMNIVVIAVDQKNFFCEFDIIESVTVCQLLMS